MAETETKPNTDKLTMLTIDKLVMAEIRVFEKMSGYTIQEVFQESENSMPTGVIMALAYLTEKRVRPSVKRERYEQLSYGGLVKLLEKHFTFDVPDEDDDDPDPTKAAA